MPLPIEQNRHALYPLAEGLARLNQQGNLKFCNAILAERIIRNWTKATIGKQEYAKKYRNGNSFSDTDLIITTCLPYNMPHRYYP